MEVHEVVARLRSRGYVLERRTALLGGATGRAYQVRTANGDWILKWQTAGQGAPLSSGGKRRPPAASQALPLSEYEVLDADPDLDASYQELLDGTSSDDLSRALVEWLTELNALPEGLGPPDSATWRRRLIEITLRGLPGACRREPLVEYSPSTAALWEWIEGTVLGCRDDDIHRDIVHDDFHHWNVLQRAGRATGIIDWDDVANGDRRFDLVTLAFYSGVAHCTEPDRTRRIRAWAVDVRDDAMALYLCHLSLRTVDWAIRALLGRGRPTLARLVPFGVGRCRAIARARSRPPP